MTPEQKRINQLARIAFALLQVAMDPDCREFPRIAARIERLQRGGS